MAFPMLAFACNEASPQLFVSNLARPPVTRPGQRPVTPDGSQSRPFRTIREASEAAQKSDYCTIRIKVDAGTYVEEVAFSRSAEIIGKDRYTTRIRGGIYSTQGMLKLWDIGFESSGIRSIRQQNGQININRVTVIGYQYTPNWVAAFPAAVELSNSQGSVTGLEVKNGDQPAILVHGASSRVKIFGATVSGNHTSAYANVQPDFERNAGAVEIANGALANLFVSNISNNQFFGVMVRDQASLLMSFTTVQGTVASSGFSTQKGPDGLLVAKGSITEVKNSNFLNNARGGILSLDSWFTMHASTVKGNKYGFINRNNTTDGVDGYDSYQCATLDNTVLAENETNYLPGNGNLPVPNKPLPVPCPPGQTCPEPEPTPPPPALVCKTVQVI